MPEPHPEIDSQVTNVLRGILDDYPDDLVLRSATPAARPAPAAPSVTDEGTRPLERAPARVQPERAETPAAAPVERPRPSPVQAAREGATAPAAASLPPVPATVERVLAREPQVPVSDMDEPEIPATPQADRTPREIRQSFDLPSEGYVYFYELKGGYRDRVSYLQKIWDDPDSNVDVFIKLLPQVEKAFDSDPRVPFAIGILQFLSERKVQGLTSLNRALDLLSETRDDEGVSTVLDYLHRAFPDDLGITERLIDHLEHSRDLKGAARILLELGEHSQIGRASCRERVS
jgi:hypothetical protein